MTMVEKLELRKFPTGIKTFDANIKGGFPSGSLILLQGGVGAGQQEFIYTSAYMLIELQNNPDLFQKMKEEHDDYFKESSMTPVGLALPEKICYISLSRSKNDVLSEIAHSFHKDYYEYLSREMKFEDLSRDYHRKSIVPRHWRGSDSTSLIEANTGKDLLANIISTLERNAQNNVIIIDSLTDLLVGKSEYLTMGDVISFLKALQLVVKRWNCLVYMLLTTGTVEEQSQSIISDAFDGSLVFEWSGLGTTRRRRNLYISKFRGLMPQMEQDRIANFEVKITAEGGFEISNVQKII